MKLKDRIIIWLARRLPTCKEVTRMASDAMERKLPLRQWINMRLHFFVCNLCLRYFKQLQFMQEAIQQRAAKIEDPTSPPPSALSKEANERMKQAIKM